MQNRRPGLPRPHAERDTKIAQAYGTTADTSSELGVYFDKGNLTRLIYAEEEVYARCVRNP